MTIVLPAVVFLTLGVALTLVALHPFIFFPVSLAAIARLRPRPLRLAPPGSLPAPRVALCVCAYNEAGIIARKVRNMLMLREALPDLEILVYVDAASDATASILAGFGDALRVVVSPDRHGKTHGMNRLVGMTDADVVVFSDANVMFAPDALPALLAPFADPQVGCVCGHLVYTSAEATATAATGSLYWRLEERIKTLESLTGSVMGADGSIFAIRRALHTPPPPDIIDDMAVSFAILCDGWRVVRAQDAVAFEETVSRPAEEFRRKTRIACQAFNVHRLMWPRLRRLGPLDLYKYVSHKLLRWFTAPVLVLAGICFAAGLILAGLWAWAAAAAVALLAGWLAARTWPESLPGKLAEIAAAFLATALGVWQSLRGQRFQTWTPPQSARGGVP